MTQTRPPSAGRSWRGGRRGTTALGGFLLAYLSAQLLVAGRRREILGPTIQAAGLSRDEVRRQLLAPVLPELLPAIASLTPPRSSLILLTPGTGRESYVLYHRALVELYPRRVVWATYEPPHGWPVWWTGVARRAGAVEELARHRRAVAVVAAGFAESPLPGPATRLPGGALLFRSEAAR